MEIDKVAVESDLADLTEVEARRYVEYVQARVKLPLKSVNIKGCGDGQVDVSYETMEVPFERIRRITGKPEK